jgi:nitroreductase
MEVYEGIRTVLAVREFQSKPVPNDVLHRVIESARLTGSSMNRQPWHFVVVQNRDTLEQLGTLVSSGKYTAQAAFAVIVAIEKSSPFGVSDASRAIQSMVLTAWSEGVGSNWTGWVGMTQVATLLGVPESVDVIAVIPFGYPAHSRTQGKKRRKNLSEIAHQERFGQPFG